MHKKIECIKNYKLLRNAFERVSVDGKDVLIVKG